MPYEREWKDGEVAEIALWKRDQKNERSPVMTGTVTMKDGNKYEVSLWKTSSQNPKAPIAKGIIKEPFERRQSPTGDFDSTIPF